MGKKSNGINILSNRPTVEDYGRLSESDKELADKFIKDGLKPNKVLRIKGRSMNPRQEDFWALSWDEIIQLRVAIAEKDMLSALKLMYRIGEKDFLRLDLFNCFAAYKWISGNMQEISDIEAQELGGEPTEEEKQAGVEKLQPFDYVVSLDVLAKKDILKYDRILAKPYSIIFRKLCLNKTIAEIQQNMIENANRKAKANSH